MPFDGDVRRSPAPTAIRLTLLVLTLATTFAAGLRFLHIFEDLRAEPLELALLMLFVISFSWLALSFWSAIGGYLSLLSRWRAPGLTIPAAPSLNGRTAILMPIYNEDPTRVFAALQAMYEGLTAAGAIEAFELFILSDSNEPDSWIAEEAAWTELCRRVHGQGRIFYRKRRRNTAYKSGNIADFCRRWGRRYDYMIVLDADSLMTADALIALASLMEANPAVGLIQAPPTIVNASTLFGRLQQFASRLYGPVFAAGTALWQQGDGNYWGHNAIIRVAAFAAHCGLPELPGGKPFGGHIMSHDFVEAALLRRAGWRVWMVPDLGGSYEETPPTLIDHAKRDRRWCQGNLQHMRVLLARKLHPMSRLHLLMGIMSYLASPIWLAFLAVGIALFAWRIGHHPVYFPAYETLFPQWPRFDRQVAIGLAIIVLSMLLLPRLLGCVFALTSSSRRLGYGGTARLIGGFLTELSISTLIAPILMLLQSGFVFSIMAGRVGGWRSQDRHSGGIAWTEAWRLLGWHSLAGVALTALVAHTAPALIWWLVPLLAGLTLAVPIVVATSNPRLGAGAAALGLLATPEETDPPTVLRRARDLRLSWQPVVGAGEHALDRLAADHRLLALHLAMLTHHSDWDAIDAESLDHARAALADGGDTTVLSRDATTALLFDRPFLEAMAAGADPVAAARAVRQAEPALPAAA